MANRHNQFSQLLGGAENDSQPLIGAIPMASVPDIGEIAASMESDAAYHAENMKRHADRLRQVADFQPKFNPNDGGIDG